MEMKESTRCDLTDIKVNIAHEEENKNNTNGSHGSIRNGATNYGIPSGIVNKRKRKRSDSVL